MGHLSEATETQDSFIQKERVALQFSRAADRYDSYASVQLQMAEQLIRWLTVQATANPPTLPPVDGSRNLVDLGCGTGALLAQLEALLKDHWEQHWELHGADLAEGMVRTASKHTSAQLTCCDLESTPYSEQFFDVVVSNATLQWCDAASAFAEVFRLLKPGGLFVFSTLGPETLREWREALNSIGMPQQRVHRFSETDAVTEMLETQGFGIEKMDRAFLLDEYPSPLEMVRSVRAIGASNANIGPGESYFGRSQYRNFLNVLDAQSDTQGCSATYEALWFQCRRAG
ncbi:MAG: methyltransferase domain-containing protein [Aureliella sp.]